MNSVQHFVKSKCIIFTSNPIDLTFDINTKTPKHHLLILADLRTMINYDDPIVKQQILKVSNGYTCTLLNLSTKREPCESYLFI